MREPRVIKVWLAAVAFLLCALAAQAAERYDPRLRFRTIRTEHFSIHYHQGEESLARRVAVMAEEVHATLSRDLLAGGARRTQVILVDQHDESNGWATPLPFNTIEIAVAPPPGSSMLGLTDDWLRLVFTHEYVHILHLDRSRGVFGGLRKIFGRAPLLFPNMFLPAWETEGLATFHETAQTGLGRLAAGEFRLIVDAAARAGRFEPIDRTTGALIDWPGGHASYAYGGRFHEYLASRFGASKLAELADVTAGRVPYLPGAAYGRVFGASARALWREFAAATAATDTRAGPADSAPVRLTHHGYFVSGPQWLPDGTSILYTTRHAHDFPALMSVSAGGGAPQRLALRYLGSRVAVHGDSAIFDQREFVRSVGLQSDLYLLRRNGGGVRRLTSGARLTDPDVAPDGRSLVAVRQGGGRTALVRLPLDLSGPGSVGAATVLIDEPGTDFSAPRWDPGGRRIAVERRRSDSRPEVIVIDADTGMVAFRVSGSDGRVADPAWSAADGTLLVAWERPRSPFQLFQVDPDQRTVRPFLVLPDGARGAAPSPDGRRIAFVGYTPDGYDLFVTDVRAPEGTPPLPVVADEAPRPQEPDVAPLPDTVEYSPSRTLLPRFWMPVLETDEDRLEVGAATVGLDALGRHNYGASVRWADRARPDWDAAYAYDRWRPTVFIAASDDLTVWRDEDYRETSLEFGMRLPFRTVRRRQTIYGALRLTREVDPRTTLDRPAIRTGYEISTARRYGYSISPEEGVTAGLAADVTRRAWGGHADAATVSADARAYPRLGGRHRILALRGAAAASWGDRAGRRVLGAGGSSAGSTIAFGRDAIGLARGFETDDIVGHRAAVLNVDYRIPLLDVERGIGRLPLFVRQLHAAVFVDAAHAWTDTFRVADVRTSVGVEFSSDVVLGHYAPFTIAAGVSRRRDPSGAADGAAIFARLGYAF